jgi:hypothetical protein
LQPQSRRRFFCGTGFAAGWGRGEGVDGVVVADGALLFLLAQALPEVRAQGRNARRIAKAVPAKTATPVALRRLARTMTATLSPLPPKPQTPCHKKTGSDFGKSCNPDPAKPRRAPRNHCGAAAHHSRPRRATSAAPPRRIFDALCRAKPARDWGGAMSRMIFLAMHLLAAIRPLFGAFACLPCPRHCRCSRNRFSTRYAIDLALCEPLRGRRAGARLPLRSACALPGCAPALFLRPRCGSLRSLGAGAPRSLRSVGAPPSLGRNWESVRRTV